MSVSVVIPTYNRNYIIRDAVLSALEQTYADTEILVIDDASTDNTREIVEGIGSPKVRYIRHEKNQGCSSAYNTGISAAQGRFIAILDSDDIWKPDYLEQQVGFLDRHPEADLVFCDIAIHGESTDEPSTIALMTFFPRMLQANPNAGEYIFSGRQMYLCLLEEVPVKPSAAVVRRELFDKAGKFDEARSPIDGKPLVPFTDWELYLRFSHTACFGYLDRPLAVQRRTPDAIHKKCRMQDKLFMLNLFLKEKTKMKGDPEALQAVNRGIAGHCSNLGWDYLHTGQRSKSLAVYLQGFKETGEPRMLLRAASTLIPLGARRMLKGSRSEA